MVLGASLGGNGDRLMAAMHRFSVGFNGGIRKGFWSRWRGFAMGSPAVE